MSDKEFDEILRAAVAESAQMQADALTARTEGQPDHHFSPHFRRRASRLLNHPLRRTRSPRQQALRTAAMILVTLGLTGTVLLSFPQVRATVWGFVRTDYPTHTEYRFTNPAPEDLVDLPTLHAGWLPEGYEETMVQNTGNRVWIEYQKDDAVIRLRYRLATEGFVFSVDNEHTTEEAMTKNGVNYTVYLSDNTSNCLLTWFSADATIFYQLEGFCETDELIKLAENLS